MGMISASVTRTARDATVGIIVCLAVGIQTVSPANGQIVINGRTFRQDDAGAGGNLPQSAANGAPATAVAYGSGKIDDVDGKLYVAWYDPPTLVGGGVATWWNDSTTSSGLSANQSGLFCSLPMSYNGPDAAYREKVKGTPIPDYPFGTLLRVTNSRSRQWIVCALTDRGPALYTGAAIDLSTDAKTALGMTPGDNGVNSFVVYEVLRNGYDPSFAVVRPIQ